SLRAWFSGFARNTARRMRRGKSDRRNESGAGMEWDALADERPAAGELLAQAELQERLIAAVRTLREPYRATVLLHYLVGLALEVWRRLEIADGGEPIAHDAPAVSISAHASTVAPERSAEPALEAPAQLEERAPSASVHDGGESAPATATPNAAPDEQPA